MKWYLLLLCAVILTPYAGNAQIAIPHGPPPDEIKLSGSVSQSKGAYPFMINVLKKYRYGNNWGEYSFPVAQLNNSCDTLQIIPNDALKIVKIGPVYYKVVKSGVEYSLQFLHRDPVEY